MPLPLLPGGGGYRKDKGEAGSMDDPFKKEPYIWHRYFCWWPVELAYNGHVRWLCWVERRLVFDDEYFLGASRQWWQYKDIKEQ